MNSDLGTDADSGDDPSVDEAETQTSQPTPVTLTGPGGVGVLTPSRDGFTATDAHAPQEFETACVAPERPDHSLMIIEDDAWDAKLLEALLQGSIEAPLAFSHADTLEAGLRRLREGRIQLVLTDLNLPDSDAEETMPRLREAAPDVPVIVLSGQTDPGLRQEALDAGALAYLVKGEVGNDVIIAEIIGQLAVLPDLGEPEEG